MLHGKSPTRRQKLLIKAAGLIPDDWLVTKDLPDHMEIEHRHCGKVRIIRKKVSQ